MPTWAKILATLVVLFVVFSVLGAVSEALIPVIVIGALMAFPGRDRARPRLLQFFPWIVGFEVAASVAFLVAGFLGKDLLAGSEGPRPTDLEIWTTVILSPVVLGFFLKRHRRFREALIAATVVSIAAQAYGFLDGPRGFKEGFEALSGVAAEVMLAVYLIRRWPGWVAAKTSNA